MQHHATSFTPRTAASGRHCAYRLLQQIEQTVPGDERGDLLVFLAGMEDISTVAEHLRDYVQRTRRWLVLPLHSALSVDEQDKVMGLVISVHAWTGKSRERLGCPCATALTATVWIPEEETSKSPFHLYA